MTEEEYRAEQAEAERLQHQINSVINQINRANQLNAELEAELEVSIQNVAVLVNNCGVMDKAVDEEMGYLANVVGQADISTKEVFDALNDLTARYFTFKNISTASKNMTQYTDEYHTKFFYYNELRRITIGYVVGLDAQIISSDTLRKKVEKAYLQNTDYWLAYCISAVMLWASDEKEAAQRAMSKSQSINYFNSCLFYLLINLRFNRIDAAKHWYVQYLDRADMSDLGDEWQYLLQAYLFGAFGADQSFQEQIAHCFKNMLAQVEVTTVDFGKKFSQRAFEFADLFLHKTDHEYALLKACSEYDEMKKLLSDAEKNAEIAKFYNALSEAEVKQGEDLPQRIENVLYSLINNYDDDEFKVVKKIKYNEAVVSARGDISAAQANYNAAFADEEKKKSFGDLLLGWAFAEDSGQTDLSVQRFSISLMKESIAKGLGQYVEKYRKAEKEKYTIDIKGCKLTCSENDYESVKPLLEKFYDKNKTKNIYKDKQALIYSGMCALSIILLLILIAYFSPAIITMGILVGIAGSFLLWRRIVDLGKILIEDKRKGLLLLKQTLDEMKLWRAAYKAEDAKSSDMLNAIDCF
jgi:hypothetical protein